MSNVREAVTECPVCGGTRFERVREVGPYQVARCLGCRLQVTTPQPSDAELGAIYGSDYFLGAGDPAAASHAAELKQATADRYLDLMERASIPARRRLLEVGCGHGDFLKQAAARGFACTGIEYSEHACAIIRRRAGPGVTVLRGEIDAVADRPGSFEACVLNDVIEHVRRPQDFLRDVHRALVPGGILFIATPSTDSWSARVLGRRWMEYKAEHLTYFNRATLPRLLRASGFQILEVGTGLKVLSIDYVTDHFVRYPVALITPLARALRALTPRQLRRRAWNVVASGIVVLARKEA